MPFAQALEARRSLALTLTLQPTLRSSQAAYPTLRPELERYIEAGQGWAQNDHVLVANGSWTEVNLLQSNKWSPQCKHVPKTCAWLQSREDRPLWTIVDRTAPC